MNFANSEISLCIAKISLCIAKISLYSEILYSENFASFAKISL